MIRHRADRRARTAATALGVLAIVMVMAALTAAFLPYGAGAKIFRPAPHNISMHDTRHAWVVAPQKTYAPGDAGKTYPPGGATGVAPVAPAPAQAVPAPSKTYPAPPPSPQPTPSPKPTPLPSGSDLPPPIPHGAVMPGVVADDHVAAWNLMVGKPAQLTVHYVSMSMPLAPSLVHSIFRIDMGAEPVIEMMPDQIGMLSSIPGGSKDAWLRKFNNEIDAIGRPIVVSFAPEMNGKWYAWGQDPVSFVAAWHHVQSVVDSPLVTWMWQPSASPAGGSVSTAEIMPYWPGSSSVSWVGLDGYYYKATDSFDTVFGNSLSEITPMGKPTLIAETAVSRTDVITGKPMDRAGKIANLFAGVNSKGLAGMIWYDLVAPPDGSPYHQDFRLDNDPAALAAYKTGVSSW